MKMVCLIAATMGSAYYLQEVLLEVIEARALSLCRCLHSFNKAFSIVLTQNEWYPPQESVPGKLWLLLRQFC